jgi:hypothetical protein
VVRAHVRRVLVLERQNLLAEEIPPALEHTTHGAIDLVAELDVRRTQVEERDSRHLADGRALVAARNSS